MNNRYIKMLEARMTPTQMKKREEIVRSMKSSQADMKKKKVTEGVLDSTDDDGWMAKSQLYKLAKYAAELHKLINDSDDLEPWVQAKITAASEDISAVKHYMEYLVSGGNDIDAVSQIQPNEPMDAPMAPTAPMPTRSSISVMPESKKESIDDVLRPVTEAKKKV